MRRWFRRHWCYGVPSRGFGYGYGGRFWPYWYRISKEEEKEYLGDLKKETELELEEIKKRLDELK
ncbi:MAG TPA: hypothetical protein PLW61_01035 [Caldisericia bacterium]|nr:hypothetical protein [Caldisericia bacterium]HPB33340.1 hypothetical protein [Caldisericia bacterium]HQL67031.1 hypothetical protein [Caldisericia bacterium]HQN48163.1 hypothetical protein [Caldisericia bacterium]HQO99687.1 hypothetical protein [Caldisericia bacterium]